MKELEKVTGEFVSEVSELMELAMRKCSIKSFVEMDKDEIEMLQRLFKLVKTSSDLLTSYQKAINEVDSKLNIITKLLVEQKENEGQK